MGGGRLLHEVIQPCFYSIPRPQLAHVPVRSVTRHSIWRMMLRVGLSAVGSKRVRQIPGFPWYLVASEKVMAKVSSYERIPSSVS